MSAEEFCKKHFLGIENEAWFIPIVAITEGYNKNQIQLLRDKILKGKESKVNKGLTLQLNHTEILEILGGYINTPVKSGQFSKGSLGCTDDPEQRGFIPK